MKTTTLRCLAAVALAAALSVTASAQSGPEAYRYWMGRFESFKAAGDYANGELAIKNALNAARGDEYAWRSLAWSQARQGKWRDSLWSAQQNVARNGVVGWSLLQLYESLMAAGDYRDAAQVLDRAVRLRDRQGIDFAQARAAFLERTSEREFDLTMWLAESGHKVDGVRRYLVPSTSERQRLTDVEITGAELVKLETEGSRTYAVIRFRPGVETRLTGKLLLKPVLIGNRLLEGAVELDPKDAGVVAFGPFVHGGAGNVYDPNLPELGAAVTAAGSGTPSQKIQGILGWIKKSMRYEAGHSDDLPAILRNRAGVCHHYCGLFSAMTRRVGIPSRILHVTVIPEFKGQQSVTFNQPGESTKAHGQNEVWLGSLGWVPLEPQSPASWGNYINNVILFDRTGDGPKDDHFARISPQGVRMSLTVRAVRPMIPVSDAEERRGGIESLVLGGISGFLDARSDPRS